jgi:hypothetical protein
MPIYEIDGERYEAATPEEAYSKHDNTLLTKAAKTALRSSLHKITLWGRLALSWRAVLPRLRSPARFHWAEALQQLARFCVPQATLRHKARCQARGRLKKVKEGLER